MAKDEKIKPIEPKQLRFCQEYVIDFNGSQAAIRAGYSKKTANEQASRMLAKVNIQEKIKELTQKVAEKLEITQEKVLAEYAKMAFFDVRTIFNENNALKSVNELNDDAGASIASIKVLEEFAGRGEERVHIGNTIEVKLNNKISALDSIRDMLGYKAPTKIANTNKNGDDIDQIDYSQYTDAELRTLAKLQSKGRASKA